MANSESKNLNQEIKQLLKFTDDASSEKLFFSTAGNISLRFGEKIIISGSGKELAKLSENDISIIGLEENSFEGAKPSSEFLMHQSIYKMRSDAKSILHFHGKFATVIACMKNPPTCLDLIPEIPAYVRGFSYVPYVLPGSAELADRIGEAFRDEKIFIVQMQNHGQVAIGKNPEETVRRAAFFEFACFLYLQNPDPQFIPKKESERLRSVITV